MKCFKVCLFLIVLFTVVYLAGPRPPKFQLQKDLPEIQTTVSGIADYIQKQEVSYDIKPDNESRILWADSVGKRTEYVLLYLHGFSAGYYEGFPVHYDLSSRFGMNAYLPRLAAHGLVSEDPLLDMTPESLYHSAREALSIARMLGEKVILMSTSAGGTLSLMLAADFPEWVDALILYSPNVRIKDKAAPLLSGPWGLQIARLVFGGKYRETKDDKDGKICRYWNCRYRLEAVVYLQQLVDARMNETEFAKVKQPVFLGYYYKDKKHQDQTVEVEAALRMFDALSTPDSLKVKRAFPEAGDHVIASELTSATVEEVESATFDFVEKVLGLSQKFR